MADKKLTEIDLMGRDSQSFALDLAAINADGYDDSQAPNGVVAAAKALVYLVMNYSRDGVGIAVINNGDEISIIGVSRDKLGADHG